MYSAPYGYPNAAPAAFNGAPPQGAPQSNQPQQQQMMFNPQQQQQQQPGQFPMAGQAGPFPGGHGNPTLMGGGAGPAGMMQNAVMPHMAVANGQSKPPLFMSLFMTSSHP